MKSSTELKHKAINILLENLGILETERFLSLVQEERFDYTRWQQKLNLNDSVESISQAAMKLRNSEK